MIAQGAQAAFTTRVLAPGVLVVGTDLGESDAHVADVALTLANAMGARLSLVHAIDLAEGDDPDRSGPTHHAHETLRARVEARDREALARLERERERLSGKSDVAIEVSLVGKHPYEAVCATADGQPGAWIVVGARRGRGSAFGTTADRVLREARVPVLVVPDTATREGARAVLAAIDAGPLDTRVLAAASSIARGLDARLGLIHVRTPGDEAAMVRVNSHLREVAPEVAASATLSVMRAEESVAKTIVDHAARTGAALIVAGTHARRGLERWALGSTAEALARVTTTPLLVVR